MWNRRQPKRTPREKRLYRLENLANACSGRALQLRLALWQPWARDKAMARAQHYERRATRLWAVWRTELWSKVR